MKTKQGGKLHCILFTIITCFSFILSSWDLEDERDLCCEKRTMEYRYISDNKDLFTQKITSLKHFLFNEQEIYLCELPSGENPKYQDLSELEAGNYTMITIGNASTATKLDTPHRGSPMKDFLLAVKGIETVQADPLYYAIRPFTISNKEHRKGQKLVTQLANVHCRLKVTVKWKNLPPVLTADPCYKMELSQCANGYELDGKEGYSIGEKYFPYSATWNCVHSIRLGLKSLELKGEFVTLRYANGHLPVLRLSCAQQDGEYKEIAPAMNLNKAFDAWGYRPSSVERQEYKIIVTIYMDGHVGITLETDMGILDWVDGGAFG